MEANFSVMTTIPIFFEFPIDTDTPARVGLQMSLFSGGPIYEFSDFALLSDMKL